MVINLRVGKTRASCRG